MGHPGPGVRGPSPLVPRPSDVQKGPKLSKFKIQNSKNNAKMGLGKKSNQQYGKAIQYCRAREPAWGGRRSTQTQPKSKIYVGSVCSRTRVTEPGVRCLRVRSGNWKCDADMAFVRALHCELVMPRMRMDCRLAASCPLAANPSILHSACSKHNTGEVSFESNAPGPRGCSVAFEMSAVPDVGTTLYISQSRPQWVVANFPPPLTMSASGPDAMQWFPRRLPRMKMPPRARALHRPNQHLQHQQHEIGQTQDNVSLRRN